MAPSAPITMEDAPLNKGGTGGPSSGRKRSVVDRSCCSWGCREPEHKWWSTVCLSLSLLTFFETRSHYVAQTTFYWLCS